MAPYDKHVLRPVLYYEFLQRHFAAQAAGNVCSVFGEDAVSLRTVHRWISRIEEGDVTFEDLPRSGRPSTADDKQLQ
ncbi:unnamed protein product [Nippostrongylus brasiliensis]|uniref:HTH_48 domain-containing protein n=1 Tax=Nippostrongylus brasiliensis TaxID=27835 RepID=A0A0N4YIK7_NIPBR|nr:unnamed protein product [Nippostrongylus brasiliensis]